MQDFVHQQYHIHPLSKAEPGGSELLRHLLAASGEVIDPRVFLALEL